MARIHAAPCEYDPKGSSPDSDFCTCPVKNQAPGLRKITHLPNATGTARVASSGRSQTTATDHLVAHQKAMEEAFIAFVGKYNRQPEWMLVSFRGCHTTFEVVVEIWEEER